MRRETVEPGAVVTRLMRSNIRFGHFEHFHHGGRPAEVRALADFVIATHHPELAGDHAAWFDLVVTRTADLMARWQAIGFAHGVMNTDNMSILGETLDYGPFGFLDGFDPGLICNHSDDLGRYAFDRQPAVALWNLQALATALQTLIPWERIEASLQGFVPAFVARYSALMRAKAGLIEAREGDEDIVTDLLSLMKRAKADYPQGFRLLARRARQSRPGALDRAVRRRHARRRLRLARPLERARGGRPAGLRGGRCGDERGQPEIRAAQLGGGDRDPRRGG